MSQNPPLFRALSLTTKLEFAGAALSTLADILQATDEARINDESTLQGIGYLLNIVGEATLLNADLLRRDLSELEGISVP